MSIQRVGAQFICMLVMLAIGVFLGAQGLPKSGGATEERETKDAKGVLGPPVLINISVKDPEASAKFYSKTFGIEFARSLTEDPVAYHAPINKEGVQLQLS